MINFNPMNYYRNLPKKTKRILYPFVLPLKILYEAGLEIRFSVYILSGKGNNTETTIKMLYITSGKVLSYFTARIYEEAPVPIFIKKAYIWQLKRILNEQSTAVDLTLIDMHKFVPFFLKVKNAFLVPSSVGWTLNINKPTQEIINGFRKNTKVTDLRRIRKFKYSYDVLSDLESLNFFYEKMHIPYMKKRHQEEAVINNLVFYKKILKSGELLFVKLNGEYIAAALCRKNGERYCLFRLGVLNGDEDFVKKGALAALYYFVILRAKEKNMKTIDFTNSRPFLSDGLLHYKRKWGTRVCQDTTIERSLYLIVNRPQNAATIFSEQPFICLDKGELKAVIFVTGDTETQNFDINNFNEKFAAPGITALKVINSETEKEYILENHD